MAQTTAGGTGPIPPARKDDTEDVAWALSTAEAMYARGDRGDALKWLRRAAEAASEAQADDRALELAKAAADLANVIGPTSMPPPPPPGPAPSVAPPPVAPPPPAAAAPAAPPAQPPLGSRPPPPMMSRPPAGAAAPTPPPPPPPSSPGARPRPAARPAPTPAVAPVAARISEGRRGRRSRPDIQIGRPSDEPTQVTEVTTPNAVPAVPPRRRGRASRPAAEEVAPQPLASAVSTAPFPAQPASPPSAPDMDAWPTQSMVGDLAAHIGGHTPVPEPPPSAPESEEKTRIGVPAYDPNVPAPVESSQSTPVVVDDPSMRPSQALRVIVWRGPDGVHVAPHGTRVAAITVDAVLVALDPAADLTAWLTGK